MTDATYPRERVEGILSEQKLAPSCRIIPRTYLKSPLGTAAAASRFCAKTDGYTVLYASPDFATAFVETVVRDRFTRKRNREILLKEVTERAWAYIQTKPRAKLRLLDLRGDGCVRLGAPTDAVKARSHAAGRALGRVVHREHKDVDGFLFASRLTDCEVYALFNRAIAKLVASDSGLLPDHPDLPDVLARHKITAVVRQ